MVYAQTESVRENETHKILWKFTIQTDPLIPARRPDLVLTKKMRICRLVSEKRTRGEGTERLEKKRTSGDLSDYSIIKISLNTEKSPGNLMKFAVTQTPERNH